MLLSVLPCSFAQTSIKTGDIIHLYDGKAPGSENWTHQEFDFGNGVDMDGVQVFFNISDPTIEVFAPEKPNGTAMVVCPGGAFCMLSYSVEGSMVAKELNKYGITAFVLKYRTQPLLDKDGNSPQDPQAFGELMAKVTNGAKAKFASEHGGKEATIVEMCSQIENEDKAFADADKAMTIIREHAADWGLDADRIGIMGFSAGAITSMHQALFNTAESKPNFTAIFYGGWTDDCKLLENTAPIFICSPANDVFMPEEALNVLKACRTAMTPVEYQVFWDCEHGFGALPTDKNVGNWMSQMTGFMKDVNFLPKE